MPQALVDCPSLVRHVEPPGGGRVRPRLTGVCPLTVNVGIQCEEINLLAVALRS